MGLIDFIKDVGHKLNIGHEDPKAAAAGSRDPAGRAGSVRAGRAGAREAPEEDRA